jgi:hypothetical protein
MFAKLARFNAFNRAGGRRFGASAACNDNQPVRRSVSSSRQLRQRPILLCHWHKAASGALECGWHTEATSASKVEEPDISRLLNRVMFARRNRLGAAFVTLEHTYCRLL